jgi:hypothetical protein
MHSHLSELLVSCFATGPVCRKSYTVLVVLFHKFETVKRWIRCQRPFRIAILRFRREREAAAFAYFT